jgi:hypothetical protein
VVELEYDLIGRNQQLARQQWSVDLNTNHTRRFIVNISFVVSIPSQFSDADVLTPWQAE